MKKYIYILVIAFLGMFGEATFAQTGKSLVLNGTDQLMKIPSHADFNITTSENFSISCWVKLNRFISNLGEAQRFITKRAVSGTPKNGYELWGGVNSSTNFYANNAPNQDGNHNNSMSVWSTKGGSLDAWFHIGFVVDRAAGKMYLYHDGQQVGTSGIKDIAPWFVLNDFDVLVGAGNPTPTTFGYHMKGEIDNLHFYKKALTANEMQADAISVVDAKTEGLVAAYDFENITGLSVPDISGNNHSGTLVNYPVEGPCIISSVSLTQDTNFTGRGNNDEVVLKAKVVTTGVEPVNLNSIKLNMDGTTAISDVKSIKIYSTGNTDKFDPRNVSSATLLATCSTPATGEITALATGQLIAGTNYLWVTYQVGEKAIEGNVIDASLLSIVTANETFNLTTTTAAGSRMILLARKLLFAPGDLGSRNYRIPGIITAKDGSLVTVTDKRKYNQTDLPHDIDVLIKRSTDGGRTWSDALTLAEGAGMRKGYGDAALVHTNEAGGLLCVFVGGEGIFDNSSPSNPTRTYICKSSDNGATWTQPIDITNQLYGSNCAVTARQGWYASFCASGNGLLTRDGRIMFVAAVRETSGNSLSNFVYYSDDNGTTWNVSERAKTGGDESKVVELNDGTILMSIRRQGGGARYFNKSTDGGITWGTFSSWSDLIEPNCNGDIIRYTSTNDGYEKDRILHSIPSHASERKNVSVFVSYDEGQTWPVKRSICPTGSAYSSLCILDDGTIGAYVEENYNTGDYSTYFTNFSLNWLTEGADTYNAPGAIKVVAKPEFSIEGGSYEDAQTVALTTATEGASIYYTLDGTSPSTTSTLYTAPFAIEETTTVKAIAIKEGMANSVVSSATYSIILPGNYCIWEGENRGGNSRVVKQIKVSGAHVDGEAQNFTSTITTGNTQTLVNIDKTADVLNATLGDELVLSPIIYALEWMHFYVYIDYNHNSVFDANELVSYSYYKGKDSKDMPASESRVPSSLPSFVIPADAKLGLTRMRVKVDWDNIDPCGSPELARNQGALIDMTVKLNSPVKHVVSFEQPEEGGSFIVKSGNTPIHSGAEIIQNTLLTVEATPAQRYKLSTIKVNDVAIEGNTFRVSEPSTISVEFVRKLTYAVTFTSSVGGVLAVTNEEQPINSGDLVDEGTELTIETRADENYQLRSLTVNDSPFSAGTYTVNEITAFSAVFTTDKTIAFSSNDGGTLTVEKTDGTSIESGSWVEDNLATKIKVVLAEGYEIVTATLNGEDISDNLLNAEGFSYTVNSNTVINVVFAKIRYKFTYSFNEQAGQVSITQQGSIVSSEDELEHGAIVTVNIRPNLRHSIKSILLNGVEKKDELLVNGNSFNLTITGAVTLEILFEADKYTLTYTSSKNGTMLVTLGDEELPVESGTEIPFGSYLTLTFEPIAGEVLKSLMINGEEYVEEVEDNLYYWDVDNSVVIEAQFSDITGIHTNSLGNFTSYINKEGHIVIENATVGSLVEVYDIAGVMIAKTIVESDIEILSSIQLSGSFYLVKVSNGMDAVVSKATKR